MLAQPIAIFKISLKLIMFYVSFHQLLVQNNAEI